MAAGFASGGSEKDETWTAFRLNARENKLHYEGTEIQDPDRYDLEAFTKYDLSGKEVHHVKPAAGNEIVIMYVDDMRALSSGITHSADGVHIVVFS